MHHSQNGVQRNAQRSELLYTQDTCQDRWAQTLTTPNVHARDTTTVCQMPQGLQSTMHAIVFALHYHGFKRVPQCLNVAARHDNAHQGTLHRVPTTLSKML